MTTSTTSSTPRVSLAFKPQLATRVVIWLIALYAIYAATQLGFSWERFSSGLGNGAKFLGRMFPPDLSKGDILWGGIKETLQIAVLASLFGILFSLPSASWAHAT